MEIKRCFEEQKKLYELIIDFLSNEEETENYSDKIINDYISEGKEKLRWFLKLILKISENHYRSVIFIKKIEQIISYSTSQIKQTFTNREIFEFFQYNKLILLFLFEQKIIIADESILSLIQEKSANFQKSTHSNPKEEESENEEEDDEYEEVEDENDKKRIKERNFKLQEFFYPEIKSLIDEKHRESIMSELIKCDLKEGEIFEEKRKKGENDSYFCEMIRQDSIESFISYVNRNCLSLQQTIEASIFETNSFLITKKPTLIEYAAFFGSIQIFQYLRMNKVKLQPSIWEYAIHGKNSLIIHLIEEDHVDPPFGSYETCLRESIKCHHNGIARYIINNLISEKDLSYSIEHIYNDNLYSYCFEYMNYSFLLENYESNYIFHYLCQFDYPELVQLYLQYGNVDVNQAIITINTLMKKFFYIHLNRIIYIYIFI